MQVADVEKLIAGQEIEVVQVGGADMDGVFRGKRILSEYFLDGCRAVNGIFLESCCGLAAWHRASSNDRPGSQAEGPD